MAVLIGLPIPLMLLVDVDRGKREGAALAREATSQLAEAVDHHPADYRADVTDYSEYERPTDQ